MLRRIRDDRDADSNSDSDSGRGRRPDRRRRRPTLEGLEGRQLLSEVVPAATASVVSPTPPTPGPAAPVIIRHTQLPPLRAWSAQPYDGVVASFISNTQIPAEHLSATIDWGDGQTGPGSIELSPWGGFNVRGAHTYGPAVSGLTWVRVDVADAQTGNWIVGVEQRALVTRPTPSRAAMFSAGLQPASAQHEPSARPQPVRLRFVERRQRYHEAADRFVQGVASADDIRYLKQVKDFQDQQNKGYFEKIGDNFVNAFTFN